MESEDSEKEEHKVTKANSPFAGLFSLVIYLYFIIALFFAFPYFNYQYASQNGFMNWLLLGEVVPTAQSFIWPYYLINSKPGLTWTEAEKQNLSHFHKSDNAARKVQQMAKNSNGSNLSQAEIAEYLSLSRMALSEAKLVDLQVLAKAHPDLPYHYDNEYIASFEMYHRSIAGNMDMASQIKSRELWDKWVDWFNENKSDIHMPKRN